MTLWADPQTALPIRVEITTGAMMEGQMVMNNFRYDVDLDPSLFSLEPPPGYSVQTMNPAMPVEDDLLRLLRLVAEHNKGVFPAAIGMNKEFMQAVQAVIKPDMDKVIAKYGKESPEMMKAAMSLGQKHMQGVMFYVHAQARERPALRRRRREAGHAGSADPLVQAHRCPKVPRHLRRPQRQRTGLR